MERLAIAAKCWHSQEVLVFFFQHSILKAFLQWPERLYFKVMLKHIEEITSKLQITPFNVSEEIYFYLCYKR